MNAGGVCFRRRLPGFIIGLLAAGYGTQVSAGALQNVFISREKGIVVIEIRFDCLHRLASQPPQGPSATFQINLTRLDQCGPGQADGGGRDSTRPAGGEIIALDEVGYLARERGEATVELNFIRPVQIVVGQTGDLRGLQVRLRAPTDTPEEATTPAKPAVEAAAPHARRVDFRLDGGLRLRSDDKQWQATLDGRVHEDFAWYDSDITQLKDGSALRRARVGLGVQYGTHLSAFTDYDFGNVARGWKNAWIQYEFSARFDVRAGSQSVPFGLADYESSNSSLLMEMALPTQLAPGVAVGGLFRGSGHSMAYSIGVFGKDLQYNDRRKLDGVSVTGRFTFTPLKERSNLLQLGASVEYRKASSGATARFRARPESFVTDVRLIDTRTIDEVDDLLGLGVEFAWAPGPWLTEAEYIYTRVSRASASDLAFGGWYATVGYLLTGEHHIYNRHTATFGRVQPDHRWGAVELAARYSVLDLTDADVLGGEQSDLAAGINWYLNPNCRLMLNYVWVDANPNRRGVNESPSVLQLRLQVGL